MKNIEKFLVGPQASIKDVITCIDKNVRGIALVVNDDGQLIGTVTDGDIRRAILDNIDLESSVLDLLSQKGSDLYKKPITAPLGTSKSDLLKLMDEYLIRQVPLLDEDGKVVEISLLSELIQKKDMPLNAVVMAGGYGRRLGSLTEKVPKPMLPVGDRPLMERIIEQLRESGIKQVNISTHYMADMIKEHFDDGSDFGVDINYVNETRPLGTAGALSLMEPPEQPLLVVNGDIMSRVDFRALHNFHQEHKADLTVGVRQFDMEVPYGVLECEGPTVHHLREKPKYKFLVNAGIYLLEPAVLGYIPSDKRYDMTDLIVRLIDEGLKVVSFPIVEYWLDIGEPIDYKQAQMDMNEWEDAD